jgi:hypothetical protein
VCDSASDDRVGCFQSQVAATGRQIGFIFPVGNMQGHFNLKGYWEFAAENRPLARTRELSDMRSR